MEMRWMWIPKRLTIAFLIDFSLKFRILIEETNFKETVQK